MSQRYRRSPETKIIALTGGGRTGNIDFLEVAAKLGASATLHKPFSYQVLLAAIDRTLGSKMVA